MLRNLHYILRVKGRIAELKEEVIFVLLEDHLSCYVESHTTGYLKDERQIRRLLQQSRQDMNLGIGRRNVPGFPQII